MYRPWFCGRSGPRTVFTIQSCEGVAVKPFSAEPDEDEVLFRPLAHFRVTGSAKKLQAADLGANPPAHGGFPDDVHLRQLPSEGVPMEPEPVHNLQKCKSMFGEFGKDADIRVMLLLTLYILLVPIMAMNLLVAM